MLYQRQKQGMGGLVIEMVAWQLPAATTDRPHGFKYRLYCGRGNECLVRHDNESGKGGHVRREGKELSYTFVPLEQLIKDFEADMLRLAGGTNG